MKIDRIKVLLVTVTGLGIFIGSLFGTTETRSQTEGLQKVTISISLSNSGLFDYLLELPVLHQSEQFGHTGNWWHDETTDSWFLNTHWGRVVTELPKDYQGGRQIGEFIRDIDVMDALIEVPAGYQASYQDANTYEIYSCWIPNAAHLPAQGPRLIYAQGNVLIEPIETESECGEERRLSASIN